MRKSAINPIHKGNKLEEPLNIDSIEFTRDLINSTIPEHLYHYTTASGLLGIFQTNDSLLTFRLTESDYLNDSSEYNLGLTIATECLNKNKSPVSNSCQQSIKNQNGRICVFSLSHAGNKLSQWRAYSANGGYSLKLDSKLLNIPVHLTNHFLTKCIYSEKVFREKVNKSIQWHARHYYNSSTEPALRQQQTLVACQEGLLGSIRVLASIFKHESFKEEAEWRYVFQYPNYKELKIRERTGLLIPFVETTHPISSLKGIRVAPGNKEKQAKCSAEDLLQIHGIADSFDVLLSSSPLKW